MVEFNQTAVTFMARHITVSPQKKLGRINIIMRKLLELFIIVLLSYDR